LQRPAAPSSIATVEITAPAIWALTRELEEFDGHEVGGGLFGAVERGRLIVDAASGRDFELRYGFETTRTPTTWRPNFDAFRSFEQMSGMQLIGDWHSHRINSGPSGTDEDAWLGLSRTRDQPWLGLVAKLAPADPVDGWRWDKPTYSAHLATNGVVRRVPLLLPTKGM
jgi:hypothetical protein